MKFPNELGVCDISETTGFVNPIPNQFVMRSMPRENNLAGRFQSGNNLLSCLRQFVREKACRTLPTGDIDRIISRKFKMLSTGASQLPKDSTVTLDADGIAPRRTDRPASCGHGFRLRTFRNSSPAVNDAFQFVE